MQPAVGDYLIIGAVAMVATAAATPLVSRLATRFGWMHEPNERSVHTEPIPHTGGMAMVIGFLVAMLAAWMLGAFDSLFLQNSEPGGIVLAVLVIFAVGFLDDIKDLPPPAKITGVVIAGVVLVQFGATMYYFRVPFLDVIILSPDWTPLVTVLWLLGMTQAINLIDGLDGLAAGIVAIGAAAFFLYANRLADIDLLPQPNVGPLIAIITVGICVGFLPYNFSPARIFMGDSGAFLLGLLMAVSTSVVGGRADPNTQAFVGQTYFFLAPLLIPVLILGVPIFDTAFAVIRRVSNRQAIDVADKGHLHHRLMNLGHGHRRSVLILWTWTALLSGFVLYPVLLGTNPTYLPFGIGALLIVLYTVLHPSVRRRRALDIERALDEPASMQIVPKPLRTRRWKLQTRRRGDRNGPVPSAEAVIPEADAEVASEFVGDALDGSTADPEADPTADPTADPEADSTADSTADPTADRMVEPDGESCVESSDALEPVAVSEIPELPQTVDTD